MNLLFVFGTRPEAIKLAPLIRELSAQADFTCKICVTGQHREMLAQVLDLFEIRPHWNLDVMRPNQSLAYATAAILSGVSTVLDEFRPDRVIVQGDTTSTLAGALAALYHRIPVAHVEAGLRTGNLYAPWPEEANRKLAGHLADLHFAPTERARRNLLQEGIPAESILVTGNTGIDALLWVLQRIDGDPDLACRIDRSLGSHLAGKRLILVTGHRRESFDGGLARMFRAVARIARRPDVAVIFPMHLNPSVRRAAEPLRQRHNVRLVEPVDYPELALLLKRCRFVVTDSGGIQEEAPSLGKPVLVTRERTERPEAVEAGSALVVGTDERRLYEAMERLLDDEALYLRMSRVRNPYGDGLASRRIAARLGAAVAPPPLGIREDAARPTP
ncbi:MAG TPA: UDP-N-acetylglucosamine 2-epimerase (non-hydrolyzing) [Stellaceae bacterium]|nr:UDP-N-acetylglucosamine 2-epimerase (non-hydrolyzing) [Stellaceae bacterium]